MNKYRVIGGILLSLVSGILLAFTQYWFLVFIPLFFIGAFLSMSKKESFLFGLFSALGMVVQILAYNGSYRLQEATVVSNVAGLPGGAVIFMVFTLLIAMLLGFFGAMAGYSISPLLGKYTGTNMETKEKEAKT
ncbi:MAG: hypothetical protein M1414_04965 [Candidatus Thermoplasmatota archaeon]|nr:hypothetical protein [Candidatus Thermoplasmatota archaeon]MCL5988238.1 hypothetical protein [Candidatus Thermoplasmatota archaeon]